MSDKQSARSHIYTKPEHFGCSPCGQMFALDVGAPDSEGRWPIEPYGLPFFAWRPHRCRNGRIRWLCWLERHPDGSCTKGRGR